MNDARSKHEWWRSFIEAESLKNVELKRRSFSFLAMSAIAVLVFSALLIANFSSYPLILNITLMGGLIAILLNVLVYALYRQLKHVSLSITFTMLLLCCLLVYSGGKEQTALYWVMFYPVVAYTMLGVKLGSLCIAILLGTTATLFFGPDYGQADYTSIVKTRFLAGFSLIIMFAFISEYFRLQSHQTMTNITYSQKQKANTDSLTGLPNRRFLDTTLLTKIQTDSNAFLPMSVVMCDVDHFKKVNDTHGHDVGDKALMHLAKLMQNQLRYSDVIARFGGEEFIICLPHASIVQGVQIADKLRLSIINHPLQLENGDILNLSASFGLAELRSVHSFEHAVKQADEALYKAKNNGRNQVATL